MTTALFGNIPSRDYLQFWQSGRFQPQRVVRFLALERSDLARLAGVAPASVRFDRKAPRDLLERLTEFAATCTLVAEYFGGDGIRTGLWFKTSNPLLGELAPRDMIRTGQHVELRRFVLEALATSASDLPRQPPRPDTVPSSNEAKPGMAVERFLRGHREELARLCKRHGVRRLAAFGSMLRSDFDPARSDVDLVVEFAAEHRSSARQYFDFKAALEALFGRPVDLVELSAMPESRLRRIIERTQVPLYAEAA